MQHKGDVPDPFDRGECTRLRFRVGADLGLDKRDCGNDFEKIAARVLRRIAVDGSFDPSDRSDQAPRVGMPIAAGEFSQEPATALG